MPTDFPGSLDTSTALPSDIGVNDTLADRIHHQLHNNLSDSVRKLQAVLGTGWGETTVRDTIQTQATQIAALQSTTATWAAFTGFIFPFAGLVAPTGFLICDGSSVLKTAYTPLWSVIGYYYGGSGANFSLPDLRGRVPVGAKTGDPLFGLLGGGNGAGVNEGTHRTIELTNLPPHTHTGTAQEAGAHQHITYASTSDGNTNALRDKQTKPSMGYNGYPTSVGGAHTHPLSISSVGGSGGVAVPLSIVQPFQVVNFIIKT